MSRLELISATPEMPNGHFTLETGHGLISIRDTNLKNSAPALLLIHGNSFTSQIFKHILNDPVFLSSWRIITFDLPGHGASSDAPNPKRTYSMRGYADLAVEILQHLSINQVVVLGWSLGGHIGIEMIPLLPKGALRGLMIVGSPPALGVEQTHHGFKSQDAHVSAAAQKDLSEEEIIEFSRCVTGPPFESWMEDAVRRADGKARYLMWHAFNHGVGVDQRKVVEEEDGTVVAVVNGADEPFVNLDYLDEIKWKRLWKGKCFRMEGLLHSPFWEKPEEFNGLLVEFMRDCEKG
ncbi:alpha/beta-hydrolase [Lindgomyces ingoldianus]|uniref:Alpha/beta-hydrolase n=1 Tax=Lindgomyces ingoldianus TaxID=673940 RepID=A0ACB6QGI8_9PLEO|nr:alpha/beta-hydrolase [Lindgomyces ingoldianus]KAF2465625.1 alpha/beta-hydrolase [Lindgomyces ingoldianus]